MQVRVIITNSSAAPKGQTHSFSCSARAVNDILQWYFAFASGDVIKVHINGLRVCPDSDGVWRWTPPPAPAEPVEPKHAYLALQNVLHDAFLQSSEGKGKDRHANGKDWTDQPICTISLTVGSGFPIGQAMKKTNEAHTMALRGLNSEAYRELLGAIVYLAAAAWLIKP